MKKSAFLLVFFLVTIFSGFAQNEVTEEVPIESLTLKKGNIPPDITTAVDQLFKGSTQLKWGVFPYELKDYGWVVNKDYNAPIDHYEVFLKTADGSDVYAVFESTGELIRYKLINKKAPVPADIMKTIQKGPYKDWKVMGDVETVRSNQKKVVEHFSVKLEKGNQRKTLYFTNKGEMLTNK
jgi:hypothetical protein